MDDTHRWYFAGLGLGILLGLGSFLVGCPLDSCVAPSIQLSHHNHQQGLKWNSH